jgi:uncharacterized protein (DUF983 family)
MREIAKMGLEALKEDWCCPKCNGTSWTRDFGKSEVRCLICNPDASLTPQSTEDAPMMAGLPACDGSRIITKENP